MTDRERELLAELAAAFPGARLFWRDDDGEIAVRALDEHGIEDALRPPATREHAPMGAADGAQPRNENERLDLLEQAMTDEGGLPMSDVHASDAAREDRLRRKARRLGLRLVRSRRRDRRAPKYGTYALLDLHSDVIFVCAPASANGYGLHLDDVEAWLDGGENPDGSGIETRLAFFMKLARDDLVARRLLEEWCGVDLDHFLEGGDRGQ